MIADKTFLSTSRATATAVKIETFPLAFPGLPWSRWRPDWILCTGIPVLRGGDMEHTNASAPLEF